MVCLLEGPVASEIVPTQREKAFRPEKGFHVLGHPPLLPEAQDIAALGLNLLRLQEREHAVERKKQG